MGIVGRSRALLAPRVKRWMAKVDNREVRQGRALLDRMRKDPPDVVALGDSTWVFTAPYDEDQRGLEGMIADRIAPASLHATWGGGYYAALMDAFVHLISTTEARPVIVVPLCARLHTVAWSRHPYYDYTGPIEFLRTVDASTPGRRVRASFPTVTTQDMQAYDDTPISTWAGDLTVGDHRQPLKDPAKHGLSEAERVHLLYAFHHGEELSPDQPRLAETRRLGASLRDLGVPVVAYQTPVPLGEGVNQWGPQFEERIARVFSLVEGAFREGYGTDIDIIPTGMTLPMDEFIDPTDATEHLNERGRRHLADAISDRILGELKRR